MANICSCCGKKLPFLDAGFDVIELDGDHYYVCSACNDNFVSYQNGNMLFEELVNDSTKAKLKEHFKKFAPDGKVVEKVRQQEEKKREKLVAQESDPLYDDIHQIAGDLRFIKSLIIFILVCGVVLGIIGVFGMLLGGV